MSIPSRKGAVPNLTPTQAGHILEEEERILSLSVFDAVDFVGACTKLGVSFASFCGLPDYKVVLTLRTSFLGLHQSAPSTDAGIAGDHERGRTALSVAKWNEVVAAVRPNVAVALSESTPLSEPVSKKRRTAATRTMDWVKRTREGKAEAQKGDSSCDYELVEPMLTANGSAGFLDMFSRNENVRELVAGLQSANLSPEKLSFMYAYSMPAILSGISAGVQLIESTLPWELAEKGIALTFSVHDAAGGEGNGEDRLVEMDLNDDVYTLDINPICRSCGCYTCKRHNRAYIHHLLTVQEMNSVILLSIHNLHRLVQLFREARRLRGDGPAMNRFLSGVLSQF